MTDLKYIGKPSIRVDALEKVTGRAKYLADYKLPGMLFARALRSDIPHGLIKKIDPKPALKIPGVKAVITIDDFAEQGIFGFPVSDQHVLAYEKVRYVGEAIAAVAAESPEAALAGVEAIIYEIEPLPAVFDMSKAMNLDAPQVGPDRSDGKHPNYLNHDHVNKGNSLAVLAECPALIDQSYSVVPQEHAYLETEGALAIPTPDGGITVYYSGQSPFINQSILSRVLGLPIDKVRVIQAHVGGSFGGKDDLNYHTSGQVAALALKTNRPVRMTFTREESMIASYKRAGWNMHILLGAEKDGTLRACKFEGLLDSGAYASQSVFTSWRASIHAMGAYRYQACNVDINCVYTNNGYAGAFRGFGNTEVCFAIEQAIDEMADQVGLDPIDFRLKNCLRVGDELPHGQVLDESVGLVECIEIVRRESGWNRKREEYSKQTSTEKRRGIGVSALFHGTSLGAEGADYAASTIDIQEDNSITLTCGLTDYGPGSKTVYTIIAAEELGVKPERINMVRLDTNTALESGPTVASRTTILGGSAVQTSARNLAKLINLAAADLLQCDERQVIQVDEKFVGPTEVPVTWEQVVDHAKEMGLVLSAHGKWTAPEIHWDIKTGRGTPYFAYHFGAQIAEVEVDLRTGKTEVINFWAAHDLGKTIFPQGAYGQLYGGVAQGLGYALFEEINYVDGYLQSVNFDEYLIPTAVDVPEISGFLVENPYSKGPYGAKNIAEPVMVPVAPAIINAIANATGRRIRTLPANLEQVLLGHKLHPKATTSLCKLGLRTI
jgi:CO/xanthine dehydrogenase Mo-binding subunit